MLKKLLKYEFRDTASVIPFFYLFVAIFAVIAVVAKQTNIVWLTGTSVFLLILVGIAAVVVTFVVIVMRFYKNLYSNEGYLMFTLPVKPQLLLASKTIVAFTWMIISMVVFVVALFVSLYCAGVDTNELTEMMSELKKYGLENIIYFIIPLIVLSIIYLINQIFFAITLSNMPTFNSIGVAAAFLLFLGTYVGLQIVQVIVTIFAPISLAINVVGKVSISFSTKNMFGFLLQSIDGNEPSTIIIGLGGYVFVVVMTCALFFFTGHMMNKKVSLK